MPDPGVPPHGTADTKARSWWLCGTSAACLATATTTGIQDQGPRALPERAGGAKVPVLGDPVARRGRDRPDPMDDALETRHERVVDADQRPAQEQRPRVEVYIGPVQTKDLALPQPGAVPDRRRSDRLP